MRQLYKIENDKNIIIFIFFQFSFRRLQNFPGTNGFRVVRGRGEVLQLRADCKGHSSDVTKFKAYWGASAYDACLVKE